MPDTTGFSPLREDEAAEDVEEAHAAPAPPASQGQPRGIRRAGRPQAPPELLTVDGTAGQLATRCAVGNLAATPAFLQPGTLSGSRP